MTQNINVVPSEPNLKDLLDLFKTQIKLELCCHHIGTIESFDTSNQTAQVSINYTKSFLQLDEVGNQTIITPNYPILVECPVICMGGGKGSLRLPISKGDECVLLFNDRDIDNWFAGSSNSATQTGRLHSFSDAIALVGVRSLPNVLTGYTDDSVALVYDQTKFELFSDKVLVTLPGGVTFELTSAGKLAITNSETEFVSALDKLFTDIQQGLVSTMLGPQPLQMSTFATDLTKFQSFKM